MKPKAKTRVRTPEELRKAPTIHRVSSSVGVGHALCGIDVFSGRGTTDPDKVTCGNCKRAKPPKSATAKPGKTVHRRTGPGLPTSMCGADTKTTALSDAAVTCKNCLKAMSTIQRSMGKPQDDHEHEFYVSSYSGDYIAFRCRTCPREIRRAFKPEERAYFEQEKAERSEMHRVSREFHQRFMEDPSDMMTPRWKLRGYDLMVAVEKWARKFPGDVRVTSCDDHIHSSTTIVLIEHKHGKHYFGTSVTIIGQNAEPFQFFLYPEHAESLEAALVSIKAGRASLDADLAFFEGATSSWQP